MGYLAIGVLGAEGEGGELQEARSTRRKGVRDPPLLPASRIFLVVSSEDGCITPEEDLDLRGRQASKSELLQGT